MTRRIEPGGMDAFLDNQSYDFIEDFKFDGRRGTARLSRRGKINVVVLASVLHAAAFDPQRYRIDLDSRV